jgi:signal transduction histidine kinase
VLQYGPTQDAGPAAGPEGREATVGIDGTTPVAGWWSQGTATADGAGVLAALVAASGDALIIIDAGGRVAGLNGAAAAFLDEPAADLLGREVPQAVVDAAVEGPDGPRRTTWAGPDGRRRHLEFRVVDLPGGAHGVWFTDITDAVRQQERLTAITRAASSVADAYSLRATLDAVATEIVMTANISAVQILALDDPHDELRILGMAGFGEAADFTERLSAVRRLGGQVMFLEALMGGKPVVSLHRKPTIMADPAWGPLHEIMGRPDWDSFVALPMIVRGRPLGVINAYYLPGEDPGPRSLAFLEAMADHAAVAIDTAALLAQTRSQAQSDERRRLARDLHDSVVQQVFSMRMQAEGLRARLDRPGADPARLRSGAEELAELSKNVLADLRGLVFELRPLDLAERGLVEAVRAHAASVEARTGLRISLHAADDLELDISIDIQEDLYRIVQEALHNVVKHAHASSAEVCFAVGGDRLRIEVRDDGSGTGQAPDGGRQSLGLISMRERTQRWGGRLVAGPRADGGWSVEVSLPLPGGARPLPVRRRSDDG